MEKSRPGGIIPNAMPELLAEAAGTGNWLEGMRFSSNVSEADVQTWVDGLDL